MTEMVEDTRPRYVLTPREKQVLDELARDGADNPQIARRLKIAEDTVKSHVRHIMKKTRHPNRTALALAWVRREFVVRVKCGNAARKK